MKYEGINMKKDVKLAIEYFKESANQNYGDAYNALAVSLEDTNPNLSYEYYKKAEGLGSIKALYNIGLLFYNGTIVEKDYDKSRSYYSKAAIKNYPQAITNLGLIYHLGSGVEKNNQLAIEYYLKASKKFCQVAMEDICSPDIE
jgi:TPR repeat protein